MYNSLTIEKNAHILIVAPHPDDETVGCGGVLAQYGKQCDILLLTDGRKGTPEGGSRSEAETAALRAEEFEAVAAFFRVRSFRALSLPDSELAANAKAVFGFDLRNYDLIFVPNRNERHPDHKAAYEMIRRMCARQRASAELIEYEVWSPIVRPNRFLDISGCMSVKCEGLAMYASQLSEIDYKALVLGLNSYRGAPHHLQYCEAYYSELADRQQKRIDRIDSLPSGVRRSMRAVKRFLRGKA